MKMDEKKTTGQNGKKRKGLLSRILESMIKTGGCCGSGENCCGPSQSDHKQKEK